MKNEFDWQIDIEEEEWGEPEKPPPARRQINPVWFMVVSTILVVGVLGGWFAGRRQVERSEADLSQSVQAVLDLERDAFLKGDGDLYFSVMADDPVWQAAQLRSENLAPVRAGYTVTRAQAQDDFIWANLSWEENGRSHQRIAFFQRQNGRLQHVPTDPNYWGKTMHLSQEWGKLTYSEIDEPFAADIAATAKKLMADTCAVQCIPDRLPVTLILTTDFSRTAAANTIHLPSPRLLTLDANGRPDGRYQEHLRQAITDYLTPATIRFALPPFAVSDEHLLNYNQAAAAFMAANPHITIELVQLETLPDDLSELTQFDGAAVTPTADMITAGLVLDLTDFAHSDADFHPNDFYELAWQGAVWRDRLWFVPQMADLRLLYYDKAAYQLAQRPEPSWQWNWADMETDMAAMIAAQPPGSVMNWGFLDVGRDSLFAYAYNESKRCRQDNCPATLQPQQVHAALNWYQQMIQQNRMPDVSTLTPYQREEFLLSKQSARRHAAIWVDEPVLYENHLLLDAIGVAPFPGLNLFDGTTPLWVDGSFISATSTRPAAVWQWLVFLSDVPPLTGFRRIPARPSIAAQTGFWFTLPRQLADPMRAAYNNARPVTIGDQLYFTPEQLT
ncbi:MAG: ABC transporter substrate-binding protein, partial [Anaerolineae bacterium]